MTTTEGAAYLGISTTTLQRAAKHGHIAFGRGANRARDFSEQQLRQYAKARGITLPISTPPKERPTTSRRPGMPTRAQEFAATALSELADDMLPAQLEHAFRLIWGRLDDDHRALLVAFVETQVRKGKRAS